MKLRTSFFDKTVFRKNLTRFAPAWGLYSIGLGMVVLTMMDSSHVWFVTNLVDMISIMPIFTLGYALLCAQLLFGDLYNSRMCNALHALPLRRETWFVTHLISGFVFHLIPTLVFSIPAALFAALKGYPGDVLVVLGWLLGVNLEFMCLFGIAVFSALLAGSRFGQAALYGIVNFGSIMIGWLVDTLIIPMYYGIRIHYTPFFWFSPAVQMMQEHFLTHTRVYRSYPETLDPGQLQMGDNFLYYFLAAAAGIALMFIAFRLYHRRKLEYAGDFMAVKQLEPVFLVIYALLLGTGFYFITEGIFGMDTKLFLFLGIIVGWFTGRMLLERTTRVFRKRNLLRCALLLAICAATLCAAAADPLGIETWVPKAEDVQWVELGDSFGNYYDSSIKTDDPEEIAAILELHQEAMAEYVGPAYDATYPTAIASNTPYTSGMPKDGYYLNFTFTYHLKNGRTVKRYYSVYMEDDTLEYLSYLLSTPKAVFNGCSREDFVQQTVVIRDTYSGDRTTIYSLQQRESLYDAILKDCAEGTTAQNWSLHREDAHLFWVYWGDQSIQVWLSNTHTIQWLRDHGINVDFVLEKHGAWE
jgi:ABC-2 type transport system permease protein